MYNNVKIDCIIIGAGFCGSVIARRLAEAGGKVLLLECRSHIAGNMYDETDANGILVQKYGPHIFHANDKRVIDFVTTYGKWTDYHHKPMVELDGIVTPSPSNFKTIDLLYNTAEASSLKARLSAHYAEKKSVTILELYNCEDNLVKQYAKKLFELNCRPYTVKQWGIPPEQVDPNVLKRVSVRLNYTEGYFDDIFQALPEKGYTRFFKKLLDHENIQFFLNTDALNVLKFDTDKGRMLFENKPVDCPVVYSGSVDELLDYRYGELPYRSLVFEVKTVKQDSFQEASVIAYPTAEGYTRITEFKKMPLQNVPGCTTIAYEYPMPASRALNHEPYYPIVTGKNVSMYNKYLSDLSTIPNLFLSGRLADYKYYNMDAAILRAFDVFEEIKEKGVYV